MCDPLITNMTRQSVGFFFEGVLTCSPCSHNVCQHVRTWCLPVVWFFLRPFCVRSALTSTECNCNFTRAPQNERVSVYANYVDCFILTRTFSCAVASRTTMRNNVRGLRWPRALLPKIIYVNFIPFALFCSSVSFWARRSGLSESKRPIYRVSTNHQPNHPRSG